MFNAACCICMSIPVNRKRHRTMELVTLRNIPVNRKWHRMMEFVTPRNINMAAGWDPGKTIWP